jgi:hypothetical protein
MIKYNLMAIFRNYNYILKEIEVNIASHALSVDNALVTKYN